MNKFDVFVKRMSALSVGPEFSDVDEFLLFGLVAVLCSQDDIEYFTITKIV